MSEVEDALASFVDARVAQAVEPLQADMLAADVAAARLLVDVDALAARVAALEAVPEPVPDPTPVPTPKKSPVRLWVGAQDLASLTDDQIKLWRDRGVGAFVASTRQLPGMGEDSVRKAARVALEDSRVVARCADLGVDVYLGCHLHSVPNTQTPLCEWFDDAGWAGKALPALEAHAAMAKRLGCPGVAFDGEMYQGTTASWSVGYLGRKNTDAEIRAKARQRGEQVMERLTAAFPGLAIMVYEFDFPGSWQEAWRRARNSPAGYDASKQLHGDFWQGMGSVPGYDHVEFFDAEHYRQILMPGVPTWDAAVADADARFHAYWNQFGFDFRYAPFTWIEHGPDALKQQAAGVPITANDRARSPEQVRAQLLAGRLGSAGTRPVYAPKFMSFDYGPYLEALAEAAA